MKKTLLLTCITIILSNAHNTIAQCICLNPLYFQTYDSISNFTYVHNSPGSLSSYAGWLWFNNPQGGNYNKIYDSIPGLSVLSANFTASCKFFPVNGNSPGHMLMMFSESNEDPFTLSYPYPKTFNDALGVVLVSPNLPGGFTCCTNPTDSLNPWGFSVFAKKDTSLNYPVYYNSIHLPSLNSWYYLMLQRISLSEVSLSVFSDSMFTQHIPGSPMCFSIDSAIGPFNYLQQGVLTTASQFRMINAYLDDLKICSGTSCTVACPLSVTEIKKGNNLFEIKSNPSTGSIVLSLNKYLMANKFLITITDVSGKKVFEKYYSHEKNIVEIAPPFADGLYFIILRTESAVDEKKIIFQRD